MSKLGPTIELKSGPIIGVFDSGFGGLTVLKALMASMPSAKFVFLGDTARLPYGSKSQRTIARYASESAQFLVNEQRAEYLVIACNTASALALGAIRSAVPVPVLGVIEPGASAAAARSKTRHVLVVATEATVASHAYAAACLTHGLSALEKACPLLVPLVEEGWIDPVDHPLTAQVVRIYLSALLDEARAMRREPDTLVLGCTHYPLLRPIIDRVIQDLAGQDGIKVIDSAEATAKEAAKHFGFLGQENRLTSVESAASDEGRIRCFATDSVEKFERLGSRFLGLPVGPVELVDLGG